MRKLIIIVFVLIVSGLGLWVFYPDFLDKEYLNTEKKSTPIDTTYTIDDKQITLVNGKAESEIAPGSAQKLTTLVFGQSTFGDLNDDGVNDAVTFITQTGGGSGTFYYAAVALGSGDGFDGMSATLLGDRITPQSILIKDGVAMVNFADRKQGEPMSAQPSVGVTKYLFVKDNLVKEFNLLNKGEQIFVGNIVMAHEVRIFTPCGGTAHWVIGTSTAYSELTKAYNDHKATSSPYSSVHVVVSGIIAPPPTDGFGMDYNYGINIKNLLKVIPKGMCSKV